MPQVTWFRVASDVTHSRQQGLERDPTFDSRQRRAETEMDAMAECKMRPGIGSAYVEAIGVRKFGFIAIG